MANKPTIQLLTPVFRMSFPSLVTAKEFKEKGIGTGKWSYNVEGIFEEDALGSFQIIDEKGQPQKVNVTEALSQLAKTTWPDLSPVEIFKSQAKRGWPLKKGDEIKANLEAKGKKADQYAGKRVINMKSNKTEKARPPILSRADGKGFKVLERSSEADMEIARNLFVGGNYAFAAISVVADVVSGFKYLTPYLNSIRYIKDGQKFGGQDLMDRFDGITGGQSDYDPTAGLDDSSAIDL